MTTWYQIYREAAQHLAESGVEEASLDAWYLLEAVTGMTRTDFLMHREEELSPEQAEEQKEYIRLVTERAKRIPLSYLTGWRNFCGLEFAVNHAVLIPRQDTECLVEAVLPYTKGAHILDLCTGSGCIAIALAVLGEPFSVTGADVSEEALAVARENGERLLQKQQKDNSDWMLQEQRKNSSDSDRLLRDQQKNNNEEAAGQLPEQQKTLSSRTNLYWIQSDLFEQVEGEFDIIVSNPPYIRSSVIETLAPEVKDFEPRLALDGAEDGLLFYRRITAEAASYLKSGGLLAFEIGYDQGDAVSELMRKQGFDKVEVTKDLAGRNRVVTGWKKG